MVQQSLVDSDDAGWVTDGEISATVEEYANSGVPVVDIILVVAVPEIISLRYNTKIHQYNNCG